MPAPVFLVRPLPSWTVPHRCRTRCSELGIFARCTAHAGHGRPACSFRTRSPADGAAGRFIVTTKAVERTAEAIGADIEMRQQRELAQALQLNLPIPLGPRIPILYVEMDGTGVPAVRKETEGRAGKQDGQPGHTREAKIGCIFTQTTVNEEGYPVRDEDSTTYVGAIETAEEFGRRLYVSLAAGMEPHGEKGRPRRRRGMGVEPGRSVFPGGHTNRRFVSCPRTPGVW